MNRKIGFLVLIILLGAVLAGFQGNPVGAADVDFKKLMGSNFGHIQKILVNLVRSNYATVPHDVAVIEEHAAELPKMIPKNALGRRELFLSLAYNLRIHAKHLRIVVETLRKNNPDAGGLLGIDYLRNTAAAHFGNIVMTCVACHNQFRRKRVK